MKAFNFLKLLTLSAALSLGGCIGTDVLDDEIRDVVLTIEVDDDVVPLLVGQSRQLEVTYENEFGVAEDITPMWVVMDNAVASVTTDGLITGLSKGQTTVIAMFEGAASQSILANVSETENEVNKVLIEAPQTMLQEGQTVQLASTAWNVNGMLIPDKAASWEVDNTSIAQVDANGLLTALSNGETTITATIDGIRSGTLIITVGGATEKTATFMGASGYTAEGTVRLFIDEGGDLNLELGSDFNTDFAQGTFIYLSNTTGGAATRSSGLEIAEVTTDGSALFNVSDIDPGVMLDTYRYVIVLCRPARITFGLADFNP